MAKGKQRAWHVLDGLYRDVEDARRHYEHDTSPEGSAAYERWLEILEIAQWVLSPEEGDESPSSDVEDDGPDATDRADGPPEGGPQLQLPGAGELADDVPRGTSQRNSEPVPLVGAESGLTDAALVAELKRRGITHSGKVRHA